MYFTVSVRRRRSWRWSAPNCGSRRGRSATWPAIASRCRAQFAGTIALTAHQRAADYTVERTRLTMIEIVVSAAVLIGLTLLGGVQALDLGLSDWLGRGYVGQIALVAGGDRDHQRDRPAVRLLSGSS